MTDPWARLSGALSTLHETEAPAAGARLAAALALFTDPGDGDLELLLTRRRDDLRHHPGQVSLPGGKVEPGESTAEAALREAHEECAVDPATVEVLGRLPAFYIPPSRFWLQVVVGRWRRPHALRPSEAEVSAILRVRASELCDPARWRYVTLSRRRGVWAWRLDDRNLLWGATGLVTAMLLDLMQPDWRGGTTADDLPPEAEERPWADGSLPPPRPRPARLPRVPELPRQHVADVGRHRPTPESVEVLAGAVAELLPPGGDLLVLAGTGGTGALGLRTAAALRARGVPVRVVLAAARTHPSAAEAVRQLGEAVEVFSGALPRAALVLDAIVGRGLDGPLRPPAREVVLALQHHTMPVVSLDLPSGLDPSEGLVGDAIAADVTLALGSATDTVLHSHMAPFVGDLYLVAAAAADPADPIVRLVHDEQHADAGAGT